MADRAGVRIACERWSPGRVEERPPEAELRRRLDLIAAIHERINRPAGPECATCVDPQGRPRAWPCPMAQIARGLDPAGVAARQAAREPER